MLTSIQNVKFSIKMHWNTMFITAVTSVLWPSKLGQKRFIIWHKEQSHILAENRG